MPITKVISGGQTGADRGGLEAAIYCNVSHGGWCPKGRKAEDGKITDQYQLTELSTADNLARTEANVVDSDATLIFTSGRPQGGSLRTVEFAMKHQKPWHHADISIATRGKVTEEIIQWLQGQGDYDHDDYVAQPPTNCILNIAGSRESKCDGLQDLVFRIMVDVLRTVNPECKSYYPLT